MIRSTDLPGEAADSALRYLRTLSELAAFCGSRECSAGIEGALPWSVAVNLISVPRANVAFAP